MGVYLYCHAKAKWQDLLMFGPKAVEQDSQTCTLSGQNPERAKARVFSVADVHNGT